MLVPDEKYLAFTGTTSVTDSNFFNVTFFISQVYVLKRPHVDEFLQRVGELFECVLFTASLAKVRLHCINSVIQF